MTSPFRRCLLAVVRHMICNGALVDLHVQRLTLSLVKSHFRDALTLVRLDPSEPRSAESLDGVAKCILSIFHASCLAFLAYPTQSSKIRQAFSPSSKSCDHVGKQFTAEVVFCRWLSHDKVQYQLSLLAASSNRRGPEAGFPTCSKAVSDQGDRHSQLRASFRTR